MGCKFCGTFSITDSKSDTLCFCMGWWWDRAKIYGSERKLTESTDCWETQTILLFSWSLLYHHCFVHFTLRSSLFYFFLDCYRRTFFYPILNNYIRIIKSFKKYILSIFNKHLQRLQKFFNLLFSIRDPRSEKIYLYTLYICGHYQHLPEVRRLGVDSWDEQICVVFLVFFLRH